MKNLVFGWMFMGTFYLTIGLIKLVTIPVRTMLWLTWKP
jgi:hypothetical protein